MSYDDFSKCTPEEFEAVCRAWRDGGQADYHDNWERMRLLAAITIQPHVKNRINPKKLLALPWEKTPAPTVEKLSPEERLRRFENINQKLR